MKSVVFYVIVFEVFSKTVLSFHRIRPLIARIQDTNINEIDTIWPNIDKSGLKEDLSKPLTEKDFENGRKLDFEQLHGINPIDSQPNDRRLFEGDIVIINNSSFGSRNAVKDNYFKWRNGRIPYILSNEYTDENRSVIARAFEDIQNRTCIKFEPKGLLDFSYLSIFPGTGCASQVGKVGGAQMVSLGYGCLRLGIVEHELMHVMGFWHEQSRADRDEYIRINWENVEKGMEGNFVKLTWNDIQSLDEDYDYGSVMHYGTHAFSRGFGSTISAIKEVPKGVQIGQRLTMSDSDVRKINKLYKCTINSSQKQPQDSLIRSLIKLILGHRN